MKTQLIPTDFIAAVNDIKLAILQARARAAQVSNVEALKLYFFVGGYISKKTRSAKWGTGAIHALSERLQVELPGLRGFSSSGIKRMRSFSEAWSPHLIIRPTALGEIRHLASDEFGARDESGSHIEIRPTALGEFSDETKAAFLKIGFSFHTSILLNIRKIWRRDSIMFLRALVNLGRTVSWLGIFAPTTIIMSDPCRTISRRHCRWCRRRKPCVRSETSICLSS